MPDKRSEASDSSRPMDELKNKTVRGSAWMVAMRMTVNGLGFLSTIVLARLLSPEDFGLVALAGSAYAFFAMLGQFGFDIPLIHIQNPDRSFYDTAWTANVLVGFFVAGAMLLVARPAAIFFDDARIEAIVYSFSLLSLAKGFENIGVVNFRKRLAFRGEFLYFVLPKMVSLVVGISAAIAMRNYWALVMGMISAQTAGLAYSHFSQPFRPRLSLTRFSELFRFTKWILVGKLLQYCILNGIEIIVGRFRGPEAVGLFGVSRELAFLPSRELAAPVNRALFPSFATIADDTRRLRAAFTKVVAVTLLMSLPAAFGIMAISESLIYVVFGDQWVDAAPLLAVLGFVGALDATNTLAEPVLMARGAVKSLTFVLAAYAAVLIPSAVIMVNVDGALGVAYAMLFSASVALPAYFYAARREVGIDAVALAGYLWRPLIASIAMSSVVKFAERILVADGTANVGVLVVLIGTGLVTYVAALALLWLLWRRPAFPEVTLLETLLGFLRKKPG